MAFKAPLLLCVLLEEQASMNAVADDFLFYLEGATQF